MFFIAYAFKGHVHAFAGQVKVVSHLSCRTIEIFEYFCLLRYISETGPGLTLPLAIVAICY